MKTEQEQIEKIMCMFNKLRRGDYCVDNCYGCCGDEKIDITCHDVVVNFIQALMQAGYGDISEYKAEREMLGSQIKELKQCLNNKCVEVYNLNRDYSNAFERLKSQQQEINNLKTDYAKLQELFAQSQIASDKEIRAQIKQAKIDVLYELKEKRTTVFIDIDEVDEAVFIDDIDELIKEVKE